MLRVLIGCQASRTSFVTVQRPWCRGGLSSRDMAKTYRLGTSRRIVNAVISPLTRLGLAGRHTYTLTVRGRKTGKAYSTPVLLVENGERWLVAPYGEVGWVRNARAAGDVALSRAGRSESLSIEEVPADQAAPVLQQYLKRVSVARPFFDAKPDSPLEVFAAEAGRHPVFRLLDKRPS
jgi:deazaflavin-dependent oxidoreductase (nitroreductase family)